MKALNGLVLAGLAAAFIVFYVFPEADLAATALFYVPGKGFPLSVEAWVDRVRDTHMILGWVAGLVTLGLGIGLEVRRRRMARGLADGALARACGRLGLLGIPPRKCFYVVACLVVAPVLIVNVGLKEHWGRARPSQTTEFGGTRTFTPAFVISDQCPRNCSFVSGEVSLGFWWTSFAFVAATARRRRLIAAAGIATGTFLAFIRVGEGGHFLSDAVVAALLTLGVCAVLHDLVFGGRKARSAVEPAPGPV